MEMRTEFHKELQGIQDDMLDLGDIVCKATLGAVQALKDRDLAAAEQLIAGDLAINAKRHAIENRCIELIATQQPMAVDLRTIMSVTSIVTDLERIGDHAEGIAKIVIMIGDQPPLKPLVDLPRMADKAVDMLHRSLLAFIHRDAAAARHIVTEDDEVDSLYTQVYRELLSFMAEDPRTITRATHLMWVAHNLERSADRATNICERVVFTVTGLNEEIGASKY
jgi:phosphate transport system protein